MAWPVWINRFDRYHKTTCLDDKAAHNQIDTHIWYMGEEAETVLTQLSIESPTEKEITADALVLYKRTVKAFQNYFNPTSNIPNYAIILSSRVQEPSETNKEFVRSMYELASKCRFTTDEKTKMIKLRLLAGMTKYLELIKVIQHITNGWPTAKKTCSNVALPYFNLKDSLAVANGIVMHGSRIVIPSSLRAHVTGILHSGHQGVSKTLQRAYNTVFWPGIKKHKEDKCLSCDACLIMERSGKKEPLLPYPIPDYPFQCIGVDIFHIAGNNYMLVVDYLSKWPVVKTLQNAMSTKAVKQVRKEVFADFASQFVCAEFSEFCLSHGIKHVTSSPFHHSSNGQVDRTIGTVKTMIKKCIESGSEYLDGLISLRNTPIAHGLLSPAKYLQGRTLRNQMPVQTQKYRVRSYDLKGLIDKLKERKVGDEIDHDRKSGSEQQHTAIGQSCYYKMANGKYYPGKIIKVLNERSLGSIELAIKVKCLERC